MTLEELQAEAQRLGYKLIKQQKYVALLKCPLCGKKPELWHHARTGMESYKCECGQITTWEKSERQARLAWNEIVTLINETNKEAENQYGNCPHYAARMDEVVK